MLIYILRHGETEYNAVKRYQGTRDIPLSDKGRAELRKAEPEPERVYVSPLSRAVETAKILFPKSELISVYDLREMCFGSFEGRSYIDMEKDPDYLAWVAANCESRCPDGETKQEFSDRTCEAFEALLNEALEKGEHELFIVAHGGTQMAVMERFALPQKDYYTWCAPNAGGFVLDSALWQNEKKLKLVNTVQYIKENA